MIDKWYYTFSIVSTYCVFASQLVSGIQLIRAVRNIRRYLGLSASAEQLSLKTLLLHVTSFGTYLVSVVILAIAFTVYLGFPGSQSAFDFYMISNIIWESSAFLSQLLMCFIFWYLSQEEKAQATDELPETEFGAINEEATVQARVWNSFLKQSYSSDQEEAGLLNYSVTPQQIIKATFITFNKPNHAYGLALSKNQEGPTEAIGASTDI